MCECGHRDSIHTTDGLGWCGKFSCRCMKYEKKYEKKYELVLCDELFECISKEEFINVYAKFRQRLRQVLFSFWPNNSGVGNDEIIDAVQRLMVSIGKEKEANGCPCLYVEPCNSQCTCAMPMMSYGCRRCARYGSLEQRGKMAEVIAEKLDGTENKVAKIMEERDKLVNVVKSLIAPAATHGWRFGVGVQGYAEKILREIEEGR